MKKYNFVPLFVFIVVSLVYSFPIFENISWWGQMDWDQFTFWNAVPRDTILRYHQFPLWNPYVNGGNVVLALVFSLFLSPAYILVLIFGPVVGVKLGICLHLFLGMFGMYLLSKQFGLARISAYLPPVVYMLSSLFALHLVEGHGEYVHIAFLPWIFLTFQKSLKDPCYIFGCICLFALMVLGGSVDILSITILLVFFFSFFIALQMRRIRPLKILGAIFVGAFLLSSIKLISMFEFLKESPRMIESKETTESSLLFPILLEKNQIVYYENTKWTNSPLKYAQPREIEFRGIKFEHGFHEYGAYIGWIPLLLAGIGFLGIRKNWPLFVLGAFSLWISLGDGAFFNFWSLIHKLPVYNSLRVPSRFIIGFIFSVSLTAGFGLSVIEERLNRKGYKKLLPIIIGFVVLDLLSVSYPLLKTMFIRKPLSVRRNSEFRQRYKNTNIPPNLGRSAMYPAFLSNSGILSGYEIVQVKKGNVLTVADADYKGEVYLDKNGGEVRIIHFSPNKIVVGVNSKGYNTVVLNQNYYNGWKIKINGKVSEAFSLDGLVAGRITPNTDKITFYYLPNSFIIGSSLSVVTAIFLLVQFIISRRKRSVV